MTCFTLSCMGSSQNGPWDRMALRDMRYVRPGLVLKRISMIKHENRLKLFKTQDVGIFYSIQAQKLIHIWRWIPYGTLIQVMLGQWPSTVWKSGTQKSPSVPSFSLWRLPCFKTGLTTTMFWHVLANSQTDYLHGHIHHGLTSSIFLHGTITGKWQYNR